MVKTINKTLQLLLALWTGFLVAENFMPLVYLSLIGLTATLITDYVIDQENKPAGKGV